MRGLVDRAVKMMNAKIIVQVVVCWLPEAEYLVTGDWLSSCGVVLMTLLLTTRMSICGTGRAYLGYRRASPYWSISVVRSYRRRREVVCWRCLAQQFFSLPQIQFAEDIRHLS
jgi:hypothetical protein